MSLTEQQFVRTVEHTASLWFGLVQNNTNVDIPDEKRGYLEGFSYTFYVYTSQGSNMGKSPTMRESTEYVDAFRETVDAFEEAPKDEWNVEAVRGLNDAIRILQVGNRFS